MTTTASDLLQETRAHLFSGQEPEGNRLNGAITNSATTINFKYALGSIVQRGVVVSVDLEDIRIWETSGSAATVVERGVNGTTQAAHNDLAYVEVRPKFSPFRILRAINEELLDLCSTQYGLFQVKTIDITYNAAIQGYDLTGATQVIEILELRHRIPGPSKNMPLIRKYSLGRNLDTAIYPSGMAVFVYQSAYPGLPIRCRYASNFSTLTNLTDDVQAVSGLPITANDLPPIGAAIRLVAPREINRNFMESQGDPHRLEEIPPGAITNSIQNLRVLRQQRIISESMRLNSDWPTYTS